MPIRSHVILAALVFAPALAAAQPRPPGPDKKPELVIGEDEALYSCKSRTGEASVTFKPETDVRELITWVMGFTCKNFVLDPRIIATSKKVTIVAPNKLTASEAYRVFLVALSTVDYTIVPKGNVLRVVESAAARHQTVPFYKNGLPDSSEQVVRYVFRPSYVQPDSLLAGFTAMKSDPGDVQVIGSMLLITDYASHVRDMMSLAKLIDVPRGSDGIYTIPVLHADAAKVADEVTGILGLQTTGAPGTAAALPRSGDPVRATPTSPPVAAAVPSKILVDARTNTLIVAASEAGYHRAKALVERLDIQLDIEGGTSFHVYRLGSAIAEELSKTINDAISGQGQRTTPAAKPGAPTPLALPAPGIDGAAIEGQVRVIGDKPTNSLIVMSSGRDYLAVKDMIKQLDLPRRQVYIEALILDVQVGDQLDIGSSSHYGIPTDNGALMLGGVQMPQLRSTHIGSLEAASGLIGGLLGPAIAKSSILGTSIPSYGLLFQALGKSSNTNILSAPSIIGVDNEEAKYKVGVNIPYKRGTTFSATVPVSNDQIERKPLLLELSIKPHISVDDSVLLEVKHDSEDLLDGDSELGPTWTTRSFETRVVVHDQQTVAIGGLIQERTQVTTAKVPLLGDLPLLGYLFKYTTKVKRKTNLVILLTPYIVKDQMDLQTIRDRKMREHDELARSIGGLNGMKYNPKIDYTRKRGLVEDINRTTLAIEEDIAARNAFHALPTVKQGPLEYAAPSDGDAPLAKPSGSLSSPAP
jgi:general secretion pathway protein D